MLSDSKVASLVAVTWMRQSILCGEGDKFRSIVAAYPCSFAGGKPQMSSSVFQNTRYNSVGEAVPDALVLPHSLAKAGAGFHGCARPGGCCVEFKVVAQKRRHLNDHGGGKVPIITFDPVWVLRCKGGSKDRPQICQRLAPGGVLV